MKHRRRDPRDGMPFRRASPASGPLRHRNLLRRAITVLVPVLIVALLAARLRLHSGGWRSAAKTDELPQAAMADSARAALQRGDWDRAQSLLGRLLQHNPRDPTLLLGSGLVWHNSAWLEPKRGRWRSATRTSLDRIGIERRALALMDSAAACARSSGEWERARERIAQAYQNLGLFTDAIDVYRQIEARDPDFGDARLLRAAVIQRLRSVTD